MTQYTITDNGDMRFTTEQRDLDGAIDEACFAVTNQDWDDRSQSVRITIADDYRTVWTGNINGNGEII